MAKGKILVTGGTGYIGSHTVVELQKAGYDALIVDNLSNSDVAVLDGIEQITGTRPDFEQLDLKDAQKTADYFSKHADIDGLIHFAAFKAVGESVEKPLMYYQNNLVSLINLLDQMKNRGLGNMVFSSSCTVYGEPDSLPVTEDMPVKPANSPYGNTKQISEEILRDTCTSDQALKITSLRYFNPIGADQSALIGELPLGVPNNLVPFITQTAIGLRDELKVFGDDYNTRDGSCIRDYIHVSDLAKAHIAALERMMAGKNASNYEVFNVGTGNGSTVFEVINSFEKVSGEKLNYSVTARRPGDVEKVYADTTQANETLGWKAEKNLDDMLSSAWAWEQKYRNK